jgi:hypothetical protein
VIDLVLPLFPRTWHSVTLSSANVVVVVGAAVVVVGPAVVVVGAAVVVVGAAVVVVGAAVVVVGAAVVVVGAAVVVVGAAVVVVGAAVVVVGAAVVVVGPAYAWFTHRTAARIPKNSVSLLFISPPRHPESVGSSSKRVPAGRRPPRAANASCMPIAPAWGRRRNSLWE